MEKAKRKERPSSENENQSSTPADKRQRDKSGSSDCDEVFEYGGGYTTKITELWNGLKFLYRRHTPFLLLPRSFSSKNSVGT